MVQYEYGQSLDRDLPWAPDPPHVSAEIEPPTLQSVFYTVFQIREGRKATHPQNREKDPSGRPTFWRIQYGFEQATVGDEPCSDVLQQHVDILSEEAGKFIGRQCVLLNWTGNVAGKRQIIAEEERELMVKDLRGNNKSYSKWIDFASTLTPTAEVVKFDGQENLAGFRFVPSVDESTIPEYREADDWRAITYISEGTQYTAFCINHPSNPKPLAEDTVDRGKTAEQLGQLGRAHSVGFSFPAELKDQRPLQVRYRMWIQGGKMPTEEIEAMARDFVDPIKITVE
jgi:hypothetical protein